MAICGLGEGLEPGLQSLGSYIVGKPNHATLFTFVSLLDVLGDFLGGPIMAWTYTIRGSDGLSAGYCFFLAAVSFRPRILRTPHLPWSRFSLVAFFLLRALSGRRAHEHWARTCLDHLEDNWIQEVPHR